MASAGELGLGFELGFKVVRRGYDRDQVDRYIASVSGGAAPADPPAFDLVRRGYDREQIDAYIATLRAEGES